jgi:hypothetical protein
MVEFGNVALFQQSKNKFAVVYGLQCKRLLTYAQACFEFGSCVMHEASCNGLISLNDLIAIR